MWLRTLAVKDFRNLRTLALEFDLRANYLFGLNAAGKTSVLEAIHYLAIGRSFRPAQDRDVIQFGAQVLQLQGEALSGMRNAESGKQIVGALSPARPDAVRNSIADGRRTGEIRSDGQTKKLFLDGIEVERLSSYLGWLPVVTLLLDDIRLIRGGPSERRGFLDLALSKISKPYLLALAEYRRVLIRRNRCLTQTPSETLLSTWDDQLANAGREVYRLRSTYLPELLKTAAERAADLSAAGDQSPSAFGELRFSYRPTVKQEGDVRANFLAALRQARARELALGVTLIGPHRDEIVIQKIPNPKSQIPNPGSDFPDPQSAIRDPQSSVDLRRFGSEGEQRSASIALKLAEAHLLRAYRQEAPVFLLDEIASELDPDRSQRLFALLQSQGQIFYAAAKPIPAQGKVFHVTSGEVKEA